MTRTNDHSLRSIDMIIPYSPNSFMFIGDERIFWYLKVSLQLTGIFFNILYMFLQPLMKPSKFLIILQNSINLYKSLNMKI